MNIILTRTAVEGSEKNRFEFTKDDVYIEFTSYTTLHSSNSAKPIGIALINRNGRRVATVLLTEKEYVEFTIEWLRFNLSWKNMCEEKTPSHFLKDIRERLVYNLEG